MGFNKKTGKNRLDKFYYLAKDQGYRSRAAYKLIQLNQKFNFLGKARVALDLCAAPGSWMQVATKYMPVSRMCIGVDLDPIRSIPNCHMLQQDITTQECRQEIKKLVGEQEVDVVLHDGAPNMGKSWLQDAYTQAELVLSALRLATVFLKENGVFVSKDYNNLLWVFNHFFRKVTATKPTASRAVSAEIFVVCEGYLKPAKIDPKLLDPRFVFKEVTEVQKPVDIFAKKKQKRHRTGYDTDSMILFTKASVLQFIHSNDPVKVLAQFNALTFEALVEEEDEEEARLYERHPKTTEEVKACLDDLKVLSHKDFKGLLKWRQKMREFAQIGKFAPKEEEEEEEVELTEEQRMNLTEAELNEALAAKNRKKKKKERKRLRLQQRAAMRMGLQTKMADEEFEAPTELGLFSLATLKSDKALNAVAPDVADPAIAKRAVDGADMMQAIKKGSRAMEMTQEVLDALELDEKEELERIKRKAPIDGVEDSDDEEVRTKKDEDMLDAMYAEYLSKKDVETKKEKAAKERVASRVGMNEAVRSGDDLGDFSAYPDTNGVESDDDAASKGLKRNRLLLAEDESEAQVSARADRWFSQDLFKDLEDEEDEEEAEERLRRKKEKEKLLRVEKMRIDQEQNKKDANERSAKRQKTEKTKGDLEEDEDEQEGFVEVPLAPEMRSDDSSEDSEELEKLRKMDAKKRVNGDFMDTEPESSESDDLGVDPDGYDTDERAEMLALAAKLKDPTERSKVIEAGFNRYQFSDPTNLPEWFVEDEKKHTQPNLPVTKEEVEEYKLELKSINSRSTKKVAEAAARKKKRAIEKLEKAKTKARTIASNGDMNDREKIKAIQKLYRNQSAKMKPNKIYAIGGKLVKTDMSGGGNARVKLVDPRLKKDKRKIKAQLKKKKSGRRK